MSGHEGCRGFGDKPSSTCSDRNTSLLGRGKRETEAAGPRQTSSCKSDSWHEGPILFIMILCFAYSGTVPFHKKAHIQKRTSDLELNALQPHFENVNILSLNMCFINKVQ